MIVVLRFLLTRLVAAGATVLSLNVLVVGSAHAQMQEKRMEDILHPDLSKTASFSGKTYGGTSSIGSKSANVTAFHSLKPVTLRAGDDSFRIRSFASPAEVPTRGFTTKSDRVVGSEPFSQGQRSFAARAVAVRESPTANKTLAVRNYQTAEGRMAGRGKQQDYFDQIRDQKNLTIEDIREVLNKPNGRPGTRPDVGVLPALPVTSANPPTVR